MKRPTSPRTSFLGALGWAVAAALFAGLGETGIAAASRQLRGRMSLFGPEAIWLRPLAELAVMAPVALVFALAWLVARPLRTTGAGFVCFFAVAGFAMLSTFEGLHWASALLLGIGLAAALARSERVRRIRPWRVAVGLLGVVLLLLLVEQGGAALRRRSTEAGRATARAGAANVLLLVLDTARAWNFGWLGHSRATTPALDRWVETGAVFTRAMATAPWTLPSHASLFTGRLPTALSAGWVTALDGSAPTLAEALGAAGYRTGGFVANYRYAGRSTGLARGFERYDDYPIRWDEALRMTSLARRVLRFPRVQQWLGEHRVLEARFAADVNDAFLRWVESDSTHPFFGFLNYVDAHSPYLPPAPFDSLWITQEDRGQTSRRYAAAMDRAFGPGPIPAELVAEYLDGYDGAIRYLDGEIERLFGELRRRGLLENTIVVLTSDHGEHFGEHHLIQHGNSLYLPLLHVPLVVVWPGRVPAGARVTAPTSLRHLAATVLDLAGVANPGLEGRSLTARWNPEGDSFGADTVVAAVDWHESLSKFPPSPLLAGSLRSVVLDSLQLIEGADGSEALFDPGRDFLERRNLAGIPGYQAELARLRGALESMTGGNRGPAPPR